MSRAPAYDPDFAPGPKLEPEHPDNFDRSVPRTPLRKRKPAKRRARVDLEKKRNPPGVDPIVRRRRWPELFEARYAISLVHSIYAAHKPPPAWEGWVQDIICPGYLGNSEGIVRGEACEADGQYGLKGRYLITLHPGFQRWALFELVKHPKYGPAYKLVSIAMKTPGSQQEPGDHKYLPPDLDRKRWGHLRGLVGDYREFHQRDFEIIRDVGDRRNQRKSAIEDKLRAPEDAERAENERVQADMEAAMIDDIWPYVTRAAGNAIVYGSDPEFAAAHKIEKESRLHIERKNGYSVIARKDSEYARLKRMEAEDAAREEAKRQAERETVAAATSLSRETARMQHLGAIVTVLERTDEETKVQRAVQRMKDAVRG